MIDIKELKTRYDEIKANIQNRYMNVDLDAIIRDQDERNALLKETEDLRAKRNETAQKMKGKLDPETRSALIAEGKAIKEELAEKEEALAAIEKKFSEEAKVTIRNLRRDANDDLKKQKKDGILTEDEQKDGEKSVQDLTDKHIKKIEAITAAKEKEIMEI